MLGEVISTQWGWLLNQGLAVFALLALGFYSVKGIGWLGNNFLLPLKDAAVDYLSTSTETMKRISATLDRQQTELNNISRKLETLDDLANRFVVHCEQKPSCQNYQPAPANAGHA